MTGATFINIVPKSAGNYESVLGWSVCAVRFVKLLMSYVEVKTVTLRIYYDDIVSYLVHRFVRENECLPKVKNTDSLNSVDNALRTQVCSVH